MFELIVKLLPDWLMPVLLGLGVWLGLNYFVIAESLANRTVANDCPAYKLAWCQCVTDRLLADARFDAALWTATFGYYKAGINTRVTTALATGSKECASRVRS